MGTVGLGDLREVVRKLDRAKALDAIAGTYMAIAHPSAMASLTAMIAREKWKAEWRLQRLARKGIVETLAATEIGVIENTRFIETPLLGRNRAERRRCGRPDRKARGRTWPN